MLKKMVNHAQIELAIAPLDPILIKSGQATLGGVDMSFVRTHRHADGANAQPEPFIPGSSLKGVIRSYSEKICRSLRDDRVPVCLPYVRAGKEASGEEGQASCASVFEEYKRARNIHTVPTMDIYRHSCPTCRLFGSNVFVGRFASSDAYVVRPALIENRDGVAIDRLTGGASKGAKYDLEVLTKGEFSATVEIRNFERWQLGLIALVVRDMEEGLVRIGFGKSRGLGRIRAEVKDFHLTYYNRDVRVLSGMASLCNEQECESYGLFPEVQSHGTSALPKPAVNGLRRKYDLSDTWRDALQPAVDDLVRFLEHLRWPDDLNLYVKRRS